MMYLDRSLLRNGGIIDTMIAASLIDENRYSYIDSVGKDYIGMRKNENFLQDAAKDFGVNPKAEMWKLPAPFVVYAEKMQITLKLWHALQHEISKQDLWDVFNLETIFSMFGRYEISRCPC